ncbi:hypothetical protein POM88_029207 [Heracleum sosnowskyi]|uniref:TF-B3 domain-containing protein n=1 Tax=Heracleum sosnowskyi TaxID=360622 RepID=A0AAD8HT77_9APIA|nr:hypothetical protein POM88_029207 [Heracleum sosnowskyi]
MSSVVKMSSFVSENYAWSYMTGCLPMPSSVAERYGNSIPDRVMVVLPNGALWSGDYMRDRNCIEGLDNMYEFYDIEPYHLFTVKYNGGSFFAVQMYNTYGVEIDYPVEPIPRKERNFSRYNGGWVNEAYYLSSDFHIDKLCAQFTYNCYNSGKGAYDLVISRSHLKGNFYTKVLSRNACSQLGLNESMNWVEIGYRNLFWKIKLKWSNGKVWLNRKWNEFTKAGQLCHGDICVFQKTSNCQKFEVCVFEKINVNNFNRTGLGEGKSIMSWLKVMSNDTILSGELEIPRVFVDKFGESLGESVHLLIPDGGEVCVHFCGFRSYLYGLNKLIAKYSVSENYVLFFDYVGNSHFYVSIYNNNCMDIFDELSVKVLLEDVLLQPKCPIVVLSDDSVDEDEVSALNTLTIDQNEILEGRANSLGMQEIVDNNNSEIVESMQAVNVEGDYFNSFAVNLSRSHVDQKGHGVYLSPQIWNVYKKWSKRTVVTLLCGEQSWKVVVQREKKKCRFGRGWDNFTLQKQLVQGQRVEFIYRNNKTFEVDVSP